MRDVDLRELQDILRLMPAMVEVHPLSLAFLPDDVRVFDNAWQMVAELDAPTPQVTKPMLAMHIEQALQHRLPALRCVHDPLTSELNRVLLKQYDFIKTNMLCQSQVANEIARRLDAEAIALMLVDGLSYADVKYYATKWLSHAIPVLVDGVSNTEQGMIRIISKPPLVNRLFDMGFRSCLGFTYWERAQEPLTEHLFAGFGERVYRVKSFDEVLEMLENKELKETFVQIVRMGLDIAAHRYREKPNVPTMVADILTDFHRLGEVYKRKGISAWVHLVSDHGILWAHEHNFQIYEFNIAEHPRHYEHAKSGKHTLTVEFEGKEFAMLEYPYLRRDLRANEWGVHGGLSFEESIVPLISIRTR